MTIGRATDQTLHLRDKRVRLQHARIEAPDGALHVSTGALSGVTVNGRSQRDARLEVGDVIEIGSNILRVIEPERGAAFAISFELRADASAEHFVADWNADAVGLAGWSKRRLSWLIAGLVLLVAVVLPSVNLLSKSVLQAGPIHAAHCRDRRRLRQLPRGRVPARTGCRLHGLSQGRATCCGTGEPMYSATSAAPAVTSNTTNRRNWSISTRRCARTVMRGRRRLRSREGGRLSGCSTRNFAVTLAAGRRGVEPALRPRDASRPGRHRHARRAPRRELRRVPQRRSPAAHACCRSRWTSTAAAATRWLSTPDDPARTVPHGDPAAVLQTLVEYYSARLLGADPDAVEQRVRRPGQALTRADRDRAAAEARVQALKVAEDLFERRACVNCHEVSKSAGNTAVPWDVAPVVLTTSFLPHANFSHAAHHTEVEPLRQLPQCKPVVVSRRPV